MWRAIQANTTNTQRLVRVCLHSPGQKQQHKTKTMGTQICFSECAQDKHKPSCYIRKKCNLRNAHNHSLFSFPISLLFSLCLFLNVQYGICLCLITFVLQLHNSRNTVCEHLNIPLQQLGSNLNTYLCLGHLLLKAICTQIKL